MTDGHKTPQLAPDAPPQLVDLVAAVERAHADHRVSFIAAGDEKIYAYGGNGTVAIVSENLFGGLVELETPAGPVRVEPDVEGRITVTSVPGDAVVDIGTLLSDAAKSIERYYARRYWR